MEIYFFLIYLLLSGAPKSASDISFFTVLDQISADNQLIDELCKDMKSGKICMNFFKLNQNCDTIIVLTHNTSKICIWSATDSITLYHKSNCFITLENEAKALGVNPNKLRLPFYEKELLYKWDIDSIKILCFYDNRTYEVWPINKVYRIIIDKNTYTINSSSFGPQPMMPSEYLDSAEIQQRINKKNELLRTDPIWYEKLFNRSRQKKNPQEQIKNTDSIFPFPLLDLITNK